MTNSNAIIWIGGLFFLGIACLLWSWFDAHRLRRGPSFTRHFVFLSGMCTLILAIILLSSRISYVAFLTTILLAGLMLLVIDQILFLKRWIVDNLGARRELSFAPLGVILTSIALTYFSFLNGVFVQYFNSRFFYLLVIFPLIMILTFCIHATVFRFVTFLRKNQASELEQRDTSE